MAEAIDGLVDTKLIDRLRSSSTSSQEGTPSQPATQQKSATALKSAFIREIAGSLTGGGMVKALEALEDRDLFKRVNASSENESSVKNAAILNSKL